MIQGKKIYFASDVHLGTSSITDPREHEQRFVRWLDMISNDAEELYLLGDIFDFWFEYRKVVPKGNIRFLGKLCELTDAGIKVHFLTGNHDLWIFDYLPSETGIIVYQKPIDKLIKGKRFYLAHGDGLTQHEGLYKILKWIFRNPCFQSIFRIIHPDCGVGLAHFWSRKSREKSSSACGSEFMGEDNEWLIKWARELLKSEHYDFFIFGHRHIAVTVDLNKDSHLVFLGDWLTNFSYGTWDGKEFKLEFFEKTKTL